VRNDARSLRLGQALSSGSQRLGAIGSSRQSQDCRKRNPRGSLGKFPLHHLRNDGLRARRRTSLADLIKLLPTPSTARVKGGIASAQAIFLDLCVEPVARDLQQLGGPDFVALGVLKGAANQVPLDVGKARHP